MVSISKGPFFFIGPDAILLVPARCKCPIEGSSGTAQEYIAARGDAKGAVRKAKSALGHFTTTRVRVASSMLNA